ncbi:MAG: CDGSH iron-sulfur domain-containing protein [Janthinobacterium lividum]
MRGVSSRRDSSTRNWWSSRPRRPRRPRSTPTGGSGVSPDHVQRVLVTPDGPILVEGPVDVDLPDGRRVRSDRPVTALCVCGRSARYPICDTSHRTRVPPPLKETS